MTHDADAAAPSHQGSLVLSGLLIAAGIAAAGMFAKVSVIFTQIVAHFGMDDVTAGLATSLPALTAVILGVSASVIVGRFGQRRVLLVTVFAGGLISLLQAISMPAWLFLVTRVFEGAAHLGIVVAAPVILLKAAPPSQRGFIMTMWSLFFGLAFAISGLVAPIVDDTFGVAGVFAGHGLIMLALGIALLIVRMPADQPGSGTIGLAHFFREHADSYRDVRVVLPGLAFIGNTFIYTAILTFVPGFVGGDAAAFLLVALPIASIAGTLLSSVIVRFFARATSLDIIAYVLVAAALLGVASTQGITLIATVIALVVMVGTGLIQGATFAMIPELADDPTSTARANGVLTQIGNIGTLAGPPVFAAIVAGSGGSMWPFATVAVIACGVGVVFSTIARRVSLAR